jgi:endonuclease/exonuclease/phosphatase family metal-dependent hydrolase
MPIDTRIRNRAQEWLAFGLLAVALGGSSYLIGAGETVNAIAGLEVGWWNIRDLSSASRDDAEIAQIAQAVRDVEVLAVGELNDPDALQRMAEELGPSWEWAATPSKVGRTANTKEFYGFLWDAGRVELVGSVQVDPDPGDLFDREPAWATFRTTDGGLDFTVIAVHITWGSRVGPRKAEIRALPAVWQRVQATTDDDDDLILVGDFNRNVGDDAFDGLLSLSGVIRANEDTPPTHISSNTTYDQVFISLDATLEWTGEWETIRFDELLFDDDDAAARLAGSDHRPVWIRLVVPSADDD